MSLLNSRLNCCRDTTGKASILIADSVSGLCLSAANSAAPAVAAECNPADPKQAWQLCKSRADCAPLHRELLKERQRRQTTQQTNQPPAPEACAQLFSEVATASSATVASALGYSEVAAASATADIQVCCTSKLPNCPCALPGRLFLHLEVMADVSAEKLKRQYFFGNIYLAAATG
jgi:hypothetical protein